MPEGPQRAGFGRAQSDFVGATVAARQAMPARFFEWGGMADLGVDLEYVVGHVFCVSVSSCRKRKQQRLRPICAWACFQGFALLCQRCAWRAGPVLDPRTWSGRESPRVAPAAR